MSEQNESRAVALYRGDATKLHPLAQYRESKVLRALAGRIRVADYRDQKLTEPESLVLAQAAVVEGLSPFPPNPEIWAWVSIKHDRDTGQPYRELTIMRGRDGTIKVAKDNMKRAGTHMLSPRFTVIPPSDKDRRALLEIPDGALAVWCEVQDYKSQVEWQERYNAMHDAGASDETIIKRIGEPPVDTGLGILEANEINKLSRGGQKMTLLERAEKRALTAALRKQWAAPEFRDAQDLEEYLSSVDTDDFIIEGTFVEADIPENETRETLSDRANEASETLYGEPMDDVRRHNYSWGPDYLEAIKPMFPPGDNEPLNLVAVLNLSPFKNDAPVKEVVRWMKAYAAARYSMDKNLKESVEYADEKFEGEAQ